MDAAGGILLAVRAGDASAAPGRTAAWLAAGLGARLTLLYVATELSTSAQVGAATGIDTDEVRQRMMQEARERTEAWGRESLAGLPFDVRVEPADDVADAIAAVAAEIGASLVVAGTEARGAIRGMILGDTTRGILRQSPCPVVVVPPRAKKD